VSESFDSDKPIKPRTPGIYLLPNLFTTSALFAGFYSVIAAYQSNFATSAIAILVALIFDSLDGRVARMTNTATTWGQLSWVVAFVYCACCGLRLARFNVAVGTADKRFFQGLACPAAAATLASFVWVNINFGNNGEDVVVAVLIATLLTAGLMVSNFAYYSFKDMGENRKVPFAMILALLLLFVTTAVDPPKMVLISFSFYAVSGPAWALVSWVRKRSSRVRRSS